MKIVGTAGHVDHGKSTLIAALTGIHPDRLKEEQEREMTIELGFGWLDLPNGEEIGIIDVPGHRDFIGNMLAGIGGIDLVMLVIAADEGVMPQTKEHLAIIDLLQIEKGLVVLSKTDLVDDPEWIDMVEQDVKKALAGTSLKNAPILRVSARNRIGIDLLVNHLEKILHTIPPKLDKGKPRLPVDRVFSMAGFGTVVTGTLVDGSFSVGDDVVCLPKGLKGKVRGLQTHNKKEDTATAGSRTAINISGIHIDEIERGDVIAKPENYKPTRRIDCLVSIIHEDGMILKNNTEVKVFIGASESIGICRTLDQESLSAGKQGLAQIELKEPIIAVRGDKLIIRRPSPSETIGGGLVIDPRPSKRHKRFDLDTLEKLNSVLKGDPIEILFVASLSKGVLSSKELIKLSGLSEEIARNALKECIASSTIILLDDPNSVDPFLINSPQLVEFKRTIEIFVSEYHSSFPLRKGIPKGELNSRMKMTTKSLNLILGKSSLVDNGSWITHPTHTVVFSSSEKTKIDQLLTTMNLDPFATPSVKEVKATIGDEVFNALVESGELTQLSADVVYRSETVQKMISEINMAMKEKEFTAGEVRDLFGTSRKYALALLEYLDSKGITIRNGDQRRIK
jgi:selenocysteine-specific elongation factor